MMHVAGGVKGFANQVQKRIKTEKNALLVTWATVLVTFMDCEFRIMTTGPIMKAVKNTINVTRSKLAYAFRGFAGSGDRSSDPYNRRSGICSWFLW